MKLRTVFLFIYWYCSLIQAQASRRKNAEEVKALPKKCVEKLIYAELEHSEEKRRKTQNVSK